MTEEPELPAAAPAADAEAAPDREPLDPAAPEAPRPGLRLGRFDYRVLVLLTLVGFLLRLLSPIMPDFVTSPTSWPPVRAWGLGHPFQSPNGYIFDEVYFAQDACRDIKGIDYLDPEPPLSKLFIAAGIEISGLWLHYDRGADIKPHTVTTDTSGSTTTTTVGGVCESQGTLPGFGTWGWRFTSLILGSLLIPLIYLLALHLWPDRFFATSAAILMSFDGMSFVQSRIGMIDVVAVFLLLLTYIQFHRHQAATTRRRFITSGLLLSLLIGLSVSAKWVTLSAWGTMLVFLVGGWLLRHVAVTGGGGWQLGGWGPDTLGAIRGSRVFRIGFYTATFLAIPFLVYMLASARYVGIAHAIPTPPQANPCGSGGTYNSQPALNLEPGHLTFHPGEWAHQVVLHDRWAYYYHKCLTASHGYGSQWWTWPLLLRPVAYYYQDNLGFDGLTHAPLRAEVFNLGNPAIWWFAIPCMVYCAAVAYRERRYAPAFIVLAFASAWLPFSGVPRVMFLYHMFGSLSFMMLAVAYSLARLRQNFALRLRLGGVHLPVLTGTHLAFAYLGLVLLIFVYFYPLWTGAYLTGDAWTHRMWLQLPDFLVTKISWI